MREFIRYLEEQNAVTMTRQVHGVTVGEIEVRLGAILSQFLTGEGSPTQETNKRQLAFFLQLGEKFADQAARGTAKDAGFDPNLFVVFDIPTPPEVRAAFIENLGSLITKVSEDLRIRIMDTIRAAVLDQVGIPGITSAVKAATGFGSTRARMIARTESLKAFNRAAEHRYQSHGVAQMMWVASFDERTDPDCEALHGQVFDVRGVHPDMPLHPNCRCAWIPVIPRKAAAAWAPVLDEARLLEIVEASEASWPAWYSHPTLEPAPA